MKTTPVLVDLAAEVEAMTNQDGKEFFQTWVKGRHTITEIAKTTGNWFLAVADDDVAYFFPYAKENGCKAGFFGNRNHYEKHKNS